MNRPVLTPKTSYRVTEDGHVLAVHLSAPVEAASDADFGREWQLGNWEVVYPRGRAEPVLLPYDLADAISATRTQLGWNVTLGERPALVPPPSRDVHFGAPTPAEALRDWQQGLAASRELAAAARELLPYAGPDQGDLKLALDRADHAVRAVPAPPASTPAKHDEGRKTAWRNLDRFQHAASELGSTVARLVTVVFTQWQQEIVPMADLLERVRELLPGHAAALGKLGAAVRAVPSPPPLPVAAKDISAAAEARAPWRQARERVRQVLTDVLTPAVEQFEERAANARVRADAALERLGTERSITSGQRDDLTRALGHAESALPSAPALPLDSSEKMDAAMRALAAVTAFDEATAAIETYLAQDMLRSRISAAKNLVSAAKADVALHR